MNKNTGNGSASPSSSTSNESFEDRIDHLKDSVRGLADIGSERAGDLKHKVVYAKDTAVSTVESYLGQAKKLIIANPLASVGIAFGIGYVAMRIVRR